MIPDVTRHHDSERPAYGLRKAIEAIKNAVPIEQVAVEYGEFKLLGNGRLMGRCVAPDHEDRTPSMTVYTNDKRFKCFGCGLRGDVIDLEEVAGRHLETWTAIVALSTRYKIELPQRPGRWHSWQDEKARIQEAAKQRVAVTYQRRLTRVYAPLVLVGGETPGEEIEALEGLASALWPISLSLAERRVAGEE
jgi:DNA primase